MLIWVVTERHHYGCDNVLGIYLSEALAKEAWEGTWGPYNSTGTVQSNQEMILFRREFSEKGLNVFQKLAFEILKGDPMALDAARDILRC